MDNIYMWATIDGESIKVERIDFFQSSFAIFIKDGETSEKMVPCSKIDRIYLINPDEHKVPNWVTEHNNKNSRGRQPKAN